MWLQEVYGDLMCALASIDCMGLGFDEQKPPEDEAIEAMYESIERAKRAAEKMLLANGKTPTWPRQYPPRMDVPVDIEIPF